MDTGFLTTIMTVVGPILLGAALAYGIFATMRRRGNWTQRLERDRSTRAVYDTEERRRERIEDETPNRAA